MLVGKINCVFIIVPYMNIDISVREFFGTGASAFEQFGIILHLCQHRDTHIYTRIRSLFRDDNGCAAVVSSFRRKRKREREREREREKESLMYPTMGSLHVYDAFSDTGPSTGIVLRTAHRTNEASPESDAQ